MMHSVSRLKALDVSIHVPDCNQYQTDQLGIVSRFDPTLDVLHDRWLEVLHKLQIPEWFKLENICFTGCLFLWTDRPMEVLISTAESELVEVFGGI